MCGWLPDLGHPPSHELRSLGQLSFLTPCLTGTSDLPLTKHSSPILPPSVPSPLPLRADGSPLTRPRGPSTWQAPLLLSVPAGVPARNRTCNGFHEERFGKGSSRRQGRVCIDAAGRGRRDRRGIVQFSEAESLPRSEGLRHSSKRGLSLCPEHTLNICFSSK